MTLGRLADAPGVRAAPAVRIASDVTGLTVAPRPLSRRAAFTRLWAMCRNIRTLHNYDPPATAEEIHDAALQYVRKISGASRPSRANAEAFDRAVQDVALATTRLLDELVTSAPPRDRELDAARRRARAAQRFAA